MAPRLSRTEQSCGQQRDCTALAGRIAVAVPAHPGGRRIGSPETELSRTDPGIRITTAGCPTGTAQAIGIIVRQRQAAAPARAARPHSVSSRAGRPWRQSTAEISTVTTMTASGTGSIRCSMRRVRHCPPNQWRTIGARASARPWDGLLERGQRHRSLTYCGAGSLARQRDGALVRSPRQPIRPRCL